VVLEKGGLQQIRYMHSDKYLKRPENTNLVPTIYSWILKRHTTVNGDQLLSAMHECKIPKNYLI